MNVHFYDGDADADHNNDVYRVVNIEWHQVTSPTERKAGFRSQNQIVAICVARNGEPVDPSTDEDDYEGYVINDSLFDVVRQCMSRAI